ncbi:VMO1 protein, partial [Anseranas semipalmata]|nr:VMO1 protein [Anseranas semipalmata]
VELPQGVMGDNTVLNGVWLHCSRKGMLTVTTQLSPRAWGAWTCSAKPTRCPQWGHQGASVQPPQHGFLHNDVAATSAHFTCSNRQVLEGPGSIWGQWGGWSPQCPRVVCGIQTWQEPAWGLKRDDTALKYLRLFCCQ